MAAHRDNAKHVCKAATKALTEILLHAPVVSATKIISRTDTSVFLSLKHSVAAIIQPSCRVPAQWCDGDGRRDNMSRAFRILLRL